MVLMPSLLQLVKIRELLKLLLILTLNLNMESINH